MDLKQCLKKAGIEQLNPMQQQMLSVWPLYEDVVLLSATGTGKTLAYLLPLVLSLDPALDKVQAVVIVPSRELALQTESVAKSLGLDLRFQCLYGGRPAMEEHQKMEKFLPQVLLATPGRLLDHMGKKNISFAESVQVVLDEFDKCLELGFQEDMRRILKRLPEMTRRVLLSATDVEAIPDFLEKSIARKMKMIRLDYRREEQRRDGFLMLRVNSPEKDKMETCLRTLQHLGQTTSIVFLGYRESVERLSSFLKSRGYPFSKYHGAMEQEDRERALARFRSKGSLALISTDLAARGLDIQGVDQVIHYHLPASEEILTHRNGRTARYGASGRSILILGPEEQMPEFLDENMPSLRIPEGNLPMPKAPFVSLYIGRGKKDKLSKGDVVGFLCKIAGMTSDEIGRIELLDHCCYVSVPAPKVKEVLRNVRDQKIKGMKTKIEEAY